MSNDDRSATFRVSCTVPDGWTMQMLGNNMRGALAGMRPGMDWNVVEVDSPDKRAHHDAVLAALVEKVRESLKDRTVTLTYASYDDDLRPGQVQVLLKGENPFESKEFSHLEDAESEQRYEAVTQELRDILSDEEFSLLDSDDEAMEEAREVVYESDDSDLVNALLDNTGPMLLRYDLGVGVWTDYTSSDEDRAQMIAEIVEALNLTEDHPVHGLLPELLTEGQRGRLYVIWSGWPKHVIEQAWPLQKPRMGDDVPAATITFGKGARLLILDGLNGSGYDVPLGAPLRVPFDADDLTTDAASGGYGWDQVAGLVRSAYEASVDIDMLTWRSADANSAYLIADSVRHQGWYVIGPNPGDERWNVTFHWSDSEGDLELLLGQDWRGEIVAKRQAEAHERKLNPEEN